MEPSSSPIETLRQLQAMLDAGTITPAEFATLKQRLVFGAAPPTGDAAAPAAALPEVAETPATAHATLPPLPPEPVVPEAAPAAPVTETLPPDRDDPPVAAPRNYLNLVLSIGGLLALLGLVLYLSLNNTKSEGVTSLTRAEEDSTAVYETGPQVAPLPAPVAAPETVRLAPVQPVAPIAPKPVPAVADSGAAPVPAAPTDSARP